MENNSDKLLAGGSSASTGVLLSTLWNQSGYIKINGFSTGYQYNEYCPMDYTTGKRSITGCTNTAAAQIIHYYIEKFGLNLQLTLTAADEYTSEYNGNTVTITQSGSSAGTISFSLVNSYLSYYDLTSGQDIAALNYACGVILEAGYSSSATGTHWNEELFFRAGFDSANSVSVYGNSNVYWGSQGNISAAGFEVLIENLTAGKVVGTSYPGHALIIDGYNASNDTFHINFGWGNSSSTRWYTRAEINTQEYYHFYYDLGVDSDYSYTVNDTDVYGTGTLVRAVEVANGAKDENLIKFSSVTNNKNLTLPNYISFSDDTRIYGFNINMLLTDTFYGWYSYSGCSVSYENFTGSTIVTNSGTPYAFRVGDPLSFEGNGALIYSGSTNYSAATILNSLQNSQTYSSDIASWILNDDTGYAFSASAENDRISLADNSLVIGDISLSSGDDYLAITGGSHLYGNVNPGSGSDTIIADSSSTVEGTLYNYANISFELNEINSNQAIWATDSLYNFYYYADLSIDIYNAKSGVYSLVSASSNTSYLNRMSFTITGSGFADYNLSCNGTNSSNGTELFVENNTLKLRVNKFSSSDVTAPGTPYYSTNHTSHDQVTISWDKSTDNVATHHYQLRYGQSSTLSGNGITTKETEIKLSGLAAGQYYYQLSAVDASGNASGWSGVKSFSIMSENTDLKIYDHEVSATDILTTQSVTLTFKVKNFGYKKAGASTVAICDGTSKILGQISINALSSGNYQTCTYTIAANTLSEGTHKIYLVADSKKTVTEDNENNNQVSLTIKATVPKPNLCIQDYEVSATSFNKLESVKISFKYANTGTLNAGASILKVYDGNTLLRTFSMGSVAAGSYRNATVTIQGSELAVGTRKIYLVADAANQLTESNEDNNKAYRTVTVSNPSDLCIKDYTVTSTSIYKNGSVKLSFKYANKGTGTAGTSVLKVYDGNTLLRTFSMGSVAAGSYREATVTIQGSELGNGARKLYLIVDAAKQLTETNEDNNKAYRTVTVTSVPDLCIQDFEVSSTSIYKNGSVKLSFKYANTGTNAAAGSILKVYDGNTLLRTFSMGSVAAGSYRAATVTIQGSELGNGARKLYLVADAAKQINESNEANNKAYRTVTVSNPPDLCIQDYKVSGTSIYKNGSVKLSFKYANKGAGDAGASILKVYDGNTLLRTFSMGSVAAGSYREATVTLQGSELGNGARKLYLVVDADKQLTEINEDNNKAYRTIQVERQPAESSIDLTEWQTASLAQDAIDLTGWQDSAPAELSGGFDLAGTDTLSSVVPSAQMASLSSESLFTETDDRNKMLLTLA